MPLYSTLADAGLLPLYPFGATSTAKGVSYCLAVQSRSTPCSPSVLRRTPFAHSTDWSICEAIATYKCLKGRLGDEETLRRNIGALERERNAAGVTIDWRFRSQDARVKLNRVYPKPKL